MNALEEFYLKLDESDWDAGQKNQIITSIVQVIDTLHKKGLTNIEHLAEIDYNAIHYVKSPERKYSQKNIQKTKSKNRWEVPFQSPNIIEFSEDDLGYLYDRFKTTRNIFAKAQYGIVLYYSKRKKNNEFVIELINALFSLLKSYINKAIHNNNDILDAERTLANALFIANDWKINQEIQVLYKTLIQYTFEIHQNWNNTHLFAFRAIIDFTNLAVAYFPDFKKYVDLKKIIEKNREVAKHLSQNDFWGAFYIADCTIHLCRKLDLDTKEWFSLMAEQYEKLSLISEGKTNMASVLFIEKAMTIYKDIKDIANFDRLQKIYQQIRTDFELVDIKAGFPEDENKRITEFIKKKINNLKEEEIIQTFLLNPMIKPLAEIKKENQASLEKPTLANLFSSTTIILDKFGNTVAKMQNDNREDFSLAQTYGFHMQIASQIIVQSFIEAFRTEKISANGIIDFLRPTWIGQDKVRRIYGRDVNISCLKLVESGVNILFRELNQWKNEPGYLPDIISTTDSLILKCEYLLRELASSIEIPTFRLKDKESDIVMEKTLDVILEDLKDKLLEDDYFFIKYILTAKAGYNLRNKIAHGLMDNIEYGWEHPLLALMIIFKLSNYKFIKNNTP